MMDGSLRLFYIDFEAKYSNRNNQRNDYNIGITKLALLTAFLPSDVNNFYQKFTKSANTNKRFERFHSTLTSSTVVNEIPSFFFSLIINIHADLDVNILNSRTCQQW